jgi:hypothetical protein
MSKAAATTKRKRNGYQYAGTTSDGVRLIKPTHGRRNFTDAQIRDIVRDMVEDTKRRNLLKLDAAE